MILVILGVFLVMLVGGIIMANSYGSLEDVGIPVAVIGAFGTFAAIILTAVLAYNVSMNNAIDDRIAMYEEENANIEAQIDTVVRQYQDYETEIFNNVTTESVITLVSLYPELKSDNLVQSQIEVYIENNNTIRSLREQKILGDVKRWWLYFGGLDK